MATKLDYIHASLTQALEHKQDLATAVVTDNDSVNWIGRLTSGSTSAVTRYKDDYIDTITGPSDTHIHSLWFSLGPISYDPADKDNKELEQQRAWSKSFGVEFQELTKRPRILGLDAEDHKAEVNIYGKSLHTEYIDSPLGINYIHPDKVEAIQHNIIGLPQSIPELDCLQWLYYGKRDNETDTTPLLENINIIGNASAITNIALWDFFQKEDNSYYRVLSEERIANKRVNKEQKSSNAYKIVTLDENGIIPDIFLGELKSNPLNIGNVKLIDNTGKFIIKNDNVTGDNFVIAIQPSDTDTDTTKLTQTTINTKDITANNITVSDTTETKILQVNEDATVTGKVSANSAKITNGLSAGSAKITSLTTSTSVSSTKAVGYDSQGKLIPITYSDATQSSAGLMSADDKTKLDNLEKYTKEYEVSAVTSETTRYIKLGTFRFTERVSLNCRITGNDFDDNIDINILSGNFDNTSVFGHYSTKSKRTLGIRVSGTFSQAIEIFLKINQLTTATVKVAVDKIYQSRISISMGGLGPYDRVLTDIPFSNYNGIFSSNIDIPGNLTIKNSADITISSFGQEALSVGSSTASNLGINANNIQARNNYSPATLYLNKKGGDVHIGEGIFSNNGKNYSGTATKIEPTYISKDLTEVASATTKYIKVADYKRNQTGTLQVYLTGSAFQDTLVINFGGGDSHMLCGHYVSVNAYVSSIISDSDSTDSNYSLYIKILQLRNLTVKVALLKGDCTINITESTTAPTSVYEWPISDGFFGNFTGDVTGNVTGSSGSAGKLTTARTAYVALGNANTTTSVDWSGTTTIPVDGVLSIENGGTGCNTAQAAANELIANLPASDNVPVDTDYFISQVVNGGPFVPGYQRRPVSKLWEYIKDKISSVLGLTATNYGGTALNATTADKVNHALTINGQSFDGSSPLNISIQEGAYNHIVHDDASLLEWANCTDGSMKKVLIKSGIYNMTKGVDFSKAGTGYVLAERGTVIYSEVPIAFTAPSGKTVVHNLSVICDEDNDCAFSSADVLNLTLYNCSANYSSYTEIVNRSLFEHCTCYNCSYAFRNSYDNSSISIKVFYQCRCYNCKCKQTIAADNLGISFNSESYFYKECHCTSCTAELTTLGDLKASTSAFACYYKCRDGCVGCLAIINVNGNDLIISANLYGFLQCQYMSSCKETHPEVYGYIKGIVHCDYISSTYGIHGESNTHVGNSCSIN